MKIGLIGLGQMGEGISRLLIKNGHEIWGYRKDVKKADEQYEKGYISGYTTSLESLFQMIHNHKNISDKKPGIFMISVPQENVEDTLNELLRLCREGDIVINYGNSSIADSWKREEYCSKLGIAYLDCDVNRDVCSMDSGYNLMVRGGDTTIATCKSIFNSLGKWDYSTRYSSVI